MKEIPFAGPNGLMTTDPNFTYDILTGTLTVTNLVAGSLVFDGQTVTNFTTTGNTILGDTSGDSLTINATTSVLAVATLGTDTKLQFRNTNIFLNSGTDGTLTVSASVAVALTAPATTVSGTLAVTGAVTLTAGIAGKIIKTSTETIAAGGTTTALDLTKYHHDIDADAGGDIFTLANGVQGQETVIVLKTATGVATITPATFLGGTSITLNAAGDSVLLRYQTTLGWSIIGGNSYAIV